jgi:hypothetical protein
VDFELIEKGIRVGSEWFPILKMAYVEGDSLGNFLRKNHADQTKIALLLEQFEIMMMALKDNGIAHGDLQHDNVVVTDSGDLRLIDYDGMYVPALAGMLSNEMGHRNYQHPGRSEKLFGPNLDNFSSWVIRNALVSLNDRPTLWDEINRDDESLFLRREDFLKPHQSAVFFKLEANEGAAKIAAQEIRTLLQMPAQVIPALGESIKIGNLPAIKPVENSALPRRVDTRSEALTARPSATLFQKYNPPSAELGSKKIAIVTGNTLDLFESEPIWNSSRQRELKPQEEKDALIEQIKSKLDASETIVWSGGLQASRKSTKEQGQ